MAAIEGGREARVTGLVREKVRGAGRRRCLGGEGERRGEERRRS